MNEKYLLDEDMVHVKLASKFGINGEVALPLSLVEDLKEHMNLLNGAFENPLNTVVVSALATYLDYINCELVPFESVKPDIERCIELDMQEMVVE